MWKRKYYNLIKNINFGSIFRYLFAFLITIIAILVGGIFFVKQNVEDTYLEDIYSEISEVPEHRVAIVFGASVEDDGKTASPVLYDRVLTAVDLYKQGKVTKILVSGDNRGPHYNEAKVMEELAIANGVKEFDIEADYSSKRTYDSCYRAKTVFGINKAILITQDFHMYRTLYLCNSLGIDAIGFIANRQNYSQIAEFELHERLALVLAFWDVNVIAPPVEVGEKILF